MGDFTDEIFNDLPQIREARRQKELEEMKMKEGDIEGTDEVLKTTLSPEEIEETIKKLKDPEIFQNIKYELDKDHIEDNKAKMFLFAVCCLSKLKPDYRFSCNLTGDSSEGKTNLWKTVCKHLPSEWYLDTTRITRSELEDSVYGFDLIYVGERSSNRENEEQLKQLSEDGMCIKKKDKDEKGRNFSIERKHPRKVIIWSTTDTSDEEEISTRICEISVHGNENKYTKVNDNTKETASDFSKEIQREKRKINSTWIEKALRLMKDFDIVTIPYAELFPVNSNNSRSQRDLKKVFNLIRSIAWIHQYQRIQFEYEGHKILVASPEDFYNAMEIGKEIFDQSLSGLEPRLQEVIDSYIKLKDSGYTQYDIDVDAPKLEWIDRAKIQKDLNIIKSDTIKKRTKELAKLNVIVQHLVKGNRVYIALPKNDSPTNKPTINPLITHTTKQLYEIIKENYLPILNEGVVGKRGVNVSLEYIQSELFSPRRNLPTRKPEKTLISELKQQISEKNLKKGGLPWWVDKDKDTSLDEKVKEAISIIINKPESNFDDVVKVLGEDGVDRLIHQGVFTEVILGNTLRYDGGGSNG